VQLDVLFSLYDDFQDCLHLVSSRRSPNLIAQNEPVYLQKLRRELDGLIAQLQELAKDCQAAVDEKHVSKRLRVKWPWKKQKIANIRDKARRIQGYLQSALDMLAFRASQ
jgi:hypothetical protein